MNLFLVGYIIPKYIKNYRIEKKIEMFFENLFFFQKSIFLNFEFFCMFSNEITNQNKLKIIFFDKSQNNDLFVSLKRENANLEMALKNLSCILSKLDHQMSKSWKGIGAH